MNYKKNHGNILLMNNKYRKLFNIKQSKGYKFMPKPKMHQNTFGGWALPEPAGGAYVLPPDPLATMGAYF